MVLISLTDFPEISQFHLSSQNVHEGFWGLILRSHSILNRSDWFKSSLWLKWSNLIDSYFHFRFLIHPGKYNWMLRSHDANQLKCDTFIFMNAALTGRWISFHGSNEVWVHLSAFFSSLLAATDEIFLFIGDASVWMFRSMIDDFLKRHLSQYLSCKITKCVDSDHKFAVVFKLGT